MKNLASLYGHYLPTPLANKPSIFWVLPSCIIGIEIEMENTSDCLWRNGFIKRIEGSYRFDTTNADMMCKYWTLHMDNSLRNAGIEFVSLPLYGVDLCAALNSVSNLKLKTKGLWNPSFSSRCSTHIHLDIRDLNKEQLLSLVCLYTLFESVMFDYWSARRKHGVYCVPISEQDVISNVLSRTNSATSDDEIQASLEFCSESNRYSALNLAAIKKYGSLEFRQGDGTLDEEKIEVWIQILMCLKKYILEFSPKTMLQHITQMNFEILSKEVFGKFYSKLFKSPDFSHYKTDMMKAKYVIKGILLGAQSYKHWGIVEDANEVLKLYTRSTPTSVLGNFMIKNIKHQVQKTSTRDQDIQEIMEEDMSRVEPAVQNYITTDPHENATRIYRATTVGEYR
jgi:Putative amidoligase enzyme